MNLFLDDVRQPPPGWHLVKTVEDCIKILKTGEVVQLSLDHDLGNDYGYTGYDVLLWLEEQIAIYHNVAVIPEVITVHSDNASVWLKMNQAIASIMRLKEKCQMNQVAL